MKIDTKGIVYLAAPYSSPDPKEAERRFKLTCRAAAKLMAAGITVFSPLANTIPAVELGGLELDHSEYIKHDKKILRHCSELVILILDGWTESVGVQMELAEAVRLQMPVHLVREDDIELLPHRVEVAFQCSQLIMGTNYATNES